MPSVQFSERELEDYLCSDNNLQKHLGLRFLKRQHRTPVGVVDIIAYNQHMKEFVVIELKKDEINAAAFFQIQRYRHYFSKVLCNLHEIKEMDYYYNKECDKAPRRRKFSCLLIGSHLSHDLNYSVHHYVEDQEVPEYAQIGYRCFGYKFNKGIDFTYYGTTQRDIEGDWYNE